MSGRRINAQQDITQRDILYSYLHITRFISKITLSNSFVHLSPCPVIQTEELDGLRGGRHGF